MHPRLFTIGPLTVYSYGLMLGVGFILASMLLTKELRRKGLDQNLGSTITLIAIPFGIAGSKLLYLLENWSLTSRDPFGMAFSPGGLTWYGGFVLATLAIMVYARRKNIPFLLVCDAASPGLMLGYGVARIGCHLSGDGDYGIPTSLPWGCVYSNGTYPPSLAFRGFPEIVRQYGVNGVVPDTIPVHPTPIYELVLAILVFSLLWGLRKKLPVHGMLFMVYLVLAAASRFLVEFIRLNPRILFGLSEAQLIATVMAAVGIAGFILLWRKKRESPVLS
jgi:phosphatidylglycerol---prolipoprotein diacylglyceryl transferase